MYETFYGLRERPFDLGSSLRFLYLPDAHQEVLDTLTYAMTSRKGVTVLTGEAGTGKTTMLRAAMASKDAGVTACVHLTNPRLTRDELFDFLARGFELPVRSSPSKTECLAALEERLIELHRAGNHSTLIVDEVQSLPDELVEEIRLLTNMQPSHVPLVSIILAGQPEFAERLDSPPFRHLKQRVALRCTLPSLSLRDTAGFIATRLRVAGGSPKQVFTREAVELIFTVSGGIPRVISVLADNALVSGFAANERPVSRARVEEVCKDFRFQDGSALSRAVTSSPVITEPAEAAPGPTAANVPPASVEPPANATADQANDRLFATYERKRFRFWRSQ